MNLGGSPSGSFLTFSSMIYKQWKHNYRKILRKTYIWAMTIISTTWFCLLLLLRLLLDLFRLWLISWLFVFWISFLSLWRRHVHIVWRFSLISCILTSGRSWLPLLVFQCGQIGVLCRLECLSINILLLNFIFGRRCSPLNHLSVLHFTFPTFINQMLRFNCRNKTNRPN
jgi:hypothetical protein